MNSRKKIGLNVSHIAELAGLTLSDVEKTSLEKQLEETIEYVRRLEEVDTKNIAPTSQVTDLENVTRDDVAGPSLSQEDALKNAKATHNGFIMTEAILGDQ